MIHGPDGKKLSKRHGATAVGDYQHLGILPEALRNFLALLGWSPGGDREIMSKEELLSLFSLDGILKKPAVFDTTKLEWMNGQYLSAKSADELYPLVLPELAKLGVDGNKDAVLNAIAVVKIRSRTTAIAFRDRKSTRLNSSHLVISYAVFCLKKKKKKYLNNYISCSRF